MNTEFFKNVSRILTKRVAEVSYLLPFNFLNAKGTSLLELIDHFQSLYYICTKGRIQQSQARIFTLKEKLGIVSRRERFHQNFQEFLVDGRVFLHAK